MITIKSVKVHNRDTGAWTTERVDGVLSLNHETLEQRRAMYMYNYNADKVLFTYTIIEDYETSK